jgi:two-component system, OmpR family, KDP operon response regulator KdpE
MKILMIEDDKETIDVIKLTLEGQDPSTTVKTIYKGLEGLETARKENFDIILLDLGLPDIDGIKVLEQLKGVPVLIISARHDPEVIVNALKLGAEDYLLKPFSCQTLFSSLRGISSKSQLKVENNRLNQSEGFLQLRDGGHEIIVRGKNTKLSEAEWKVLNILINHCGRIVPIQVLLKSLSDDRYASEPSIEVIIYLLRKKLGDDLVKPKIILSEYGAGYRFIWPSICSDPQGEMGPGRINYN